MYVTSCVGLICACMVDFCKADHRYIATENAVIIQVIIIRK